MRLASRIAKAASFLETAGIASPLADARSLAAFVVQTEPSQLFFAQDFSPEQEAAFEALLARRAAREPLQHIVGSAPFGPLDLAVGPGVFIPRPETELLADWGFQRLISAAQRSDNHPLHAVDLCTGSGAISCFLAYSAAQHHMDLHIDTVEYDPVAAQWAQRNIDNTLAACADMSPHNKISITLIQGDIRDRDLLSAKAGQCDLVLSNPPYVPSQSWVDEETRQDPPIAVFGGIDGMELMPAVFDQAVSLLAPGGYVGIEHDDSTQEAMLDCAHSYPALHDIRCMQDLAGRPRFLLARKEG